MNLYIYISLSNQIRQFGMFGAGDISQLSGGGRDGGGGGEGGKWRL